MTSEHSAPRASPEKTVTFYVSAAAVGLFLVRVLGAEWSTKFAPVFPDSVSYLDVASRGPFRPFDERPFVYPSYLWLVGRSSHLAVIGQTVAYTAAFVVLAVVAWRVLSSRVAAAVAIALVLVIAVQPRYALWNTQILSESLGITLAVASIAAWWAFCARPTPRGVIWAWLWTLLWLGTRDSHMLPTIAVILPTVVGATLLWRGIERAVRTRLLAGAAVTVFALGFIYIAQDVSNRNQYPFHNNIGTRVLPDPALTQWFVEGGMPLDDALRARTGRVSWDDDEAFLTAPELEGYRKWADGAGSRRFFLSFVVQFPAWYERLVDELPASLSDPMESYDTYGVRRRLPSNIPLQLGGPESNGSLVAWTFLALLGIAGAAIAAVVARGPAPVVVFAAAGLFSSFVELYGAFVGDSVEVSRHLIGPTLRLCVMLAIGIAIGIDAIERLAVRRVAADVTAAGVTAGERTDD